MIWLCRCGFANDTGKANCGRCGRNRWTGEPGKSLPIFDRDKDEEDDDIPIALPPPDDDQ